MAACKIAIGVYSPAIPSDRLLVGSELRFGVAHPNQPEVGTRITRLSRNASWV